MRKLLVVAGFMVIAGMIAAPVLAGWGPGRGWGGYGPCWSDNQGPADNSLTEEQSAQLNDLNQKYATESSAIRSELWAKRGELNGLLYSENPDVAKVKELQAQISELRSKMDQARIDYTLEARKIAPNADLYSGGPQSGRGWGMRGGYGPGPMMGGGYGPGPGYGRGYGYGPCWN